MMPQRQTIFPNRRPTRRRCSGQTLVLAAVFLIALMGIVGLIGDGGMVAANRRHAQRAADAAAQAGAEEFLAGFGGRDQNNARDSAVEVALLNGTASGDHVLVEIPPAPASGSAYAGSNGFIRVEVTRPVELSLMNLLLQRDVVNVRASATAGIVWMPYDDTSILLLSPNRREALKLNESAALDVGRGTIWVNSSHAEAIVVESRASITAATIGVVGGISAKSSSRIDGTVIQGPPTLALDDPFVSVPEPDLNGHVTSPDSGGTAADPKTKKISGGTPTLRPGIYWGGLEISRATVTLQPGRYIFAGGGLIVKDDSTLSGTDIFIYNTKDPQHPGGDGAFERITVEDSSDVSLQAPTVFTDSTYAGFLFFNDRASDKEIKLRKRADSLFMGYVYNKKGRFRVENRCQFRGLGVVASIMELTGSASVTMGPLDRNRMPGSMVARLME